MFADNWLIFKDSLKVQAIMEEFPDNSQIQYAVQTYTSYLPNSKTLIIDGKIIYTEDRNDIVGMKLKNMFVQLVYDKSITDIKCCLWTVYQERIKLYDNLNKSEKICLPVNIAMCFGLPFHTQKKDKKNDYVYEKLNYVYHEYLNNSSLIIGDIIECSPVMTTRQTIPVLTHNKNPIDHLAELIWKLCTTSLGIFLEELLFEAVLKLNYAEFMIDFQNTSDNCCIGCQQNTH